MAREDKVNDRLTSEHGTASAASDSVTAKPHFFFVQLSRARLFLCRGKYWRTTSDVNSRWSRLCRTPCLGSTQHEQIYRRAHSSNAIRFQQANHWHIWLTSRTNRMCVWSRMETKNFSRCDKCECAQMEFRFTFASFNHNTRSHPVDWLINSILGEERERERGRVYYVFGEIVFTLWIATRKMSMSPPLSIEHECGPQCIEERSSF